MSKEFLAFYPEFLARIHTYLKSRNKLEENIIDHLLKLVDVATFGGKHTRGVLCAHAFLETSGIHKSDPKAKIGFMLGWVIELLQGAYLIADDLMDQSELRRGRKCWYLEEGIGKQAANESVILESLTIFLVELLRSEIGDERVDEIESKIRYANVLAIVGQHYDCQSQRHTFDYYSLVVQNKTGYYSFILPVEVGMIAGGKSGTKEMIDLLTRIGFLFQAQDDFLDVFGRQTETGKIGSDIRNRKVTWLSCKAYELANEQQKLALDEGFAKDPDKVMSVYVELNICDLFRRFAASELAAIEQQIGQLQNCHREIIGTVLHMIKNRSV